MRAGLVAFASAALGLALLVRRRRVPAKGSKRGSISSPLALDGVAVGVDIGGTNVKIGVIDVRDGLLLQRASFPIDPAAPPEAVIDRLHSSVSELLAKTHFGSHAQVAIGVCCPGRVENGVVSTIANLPKWENVNAGELIKRRFGTQCRSIAVINDAKAALEGEMWSGAARGTTDVVLIVLGTGVGAAVASGGVILRGSTGMFGEIGHHIIHKNGHLSKTTNVAGIAEEYCSIRSIARYWEELAPAGQPCPSPEVLFNNAKEKDDAVAKEVVNKLADHVGVIIINACRCYDPEVVLIGGGLASDEWFVQKCNEATMQYQWSLAPPTYLIKRCKHANQAGLIGAAHAALV